MYMKLGLIIQRQAFREGSLRTICRTSKKISAELSIGEGLDGALALGSLKWDALVARDSLRI